MAKLHSYYRLCPLIDQKSLFGVTPDKTAGCVIATLGKNVVNMYRLSDQKQIGGWSSKYHISAPVIYDDTSDKYIGVFNENIIKSWDSETINLDKLKKYKFQQSIWRILRNKTSIVIFKSGASVSLEYAQNYSKKSTYKAIISDDETILDCAVIKLKEKHVLHYITKTAARVNVVMCPLDAGTFLVQEKKVKRFSCERVESDNLYVSGYALSTLENNEVAYILWNDSKLQKFDLIKQEWTTIGSVPWISASSPVSISTMDDKHIALYGADLSQEGAILIVYNVSLGIGSCRHPLKMYCTGARLWCAEEKLLLEGVNHLGVLPYALEAERSLATLIGSHNIEECAQFKIADWGEGDASMDVEEEWEELARRGMAERDICLQYFPSLLQQNDTTKILTAVNQFKDIPETIIVQLLKHILQQIIPVVQNDGIADFATLYKSESTAFDFLNTVLNMPFSNVDLIPQLQNNLNAMHAIFLIKYLCFLLEFESGDAVDHAFECKLLSWSTLVIDALYQQYLLQKNERVIVALSSLMKTVKNLIDVQSDVESAASVLLNLSKGKSKNQAKANTNDALNYCIEIIKLY